MQPTGGSSDRARRRHGYQTLDEQLDAPALPGTVVAAPTADDVIDRLGADLVMHAEQCVRDYEDFHLALSGGSTPEPLYERLMYDPDFRRLPWRRTHLWVVDERAVPLDDERSNFRMIRETIVDHADIPPEQVHPIPAVEADADRQYERAINEAMLWRVKGQDRLDFILLGVGSDGHTASLFAGSDALHERHRLVRAVHHPPATPPDRVTMTFRLINASRMIAVLVTGVSKAPVIAQLAAGSETVEVLPARGIAPVDGELRWYLDAAACGQADESEA